MNDTLIFLHLPRTGGTTLRDILDKQYPDDVTLENKSLLDTDPNFNVDNKPEKDQFKLVKGHVYFRIHEHINQKCTYFSMMRNPIERTISIYNYIKKRSSHKDYDLANKLTIEEFIKRGHNLFINNGQTRLMAGREASLNVPFNEINEIHLEQAKKHSKPLYTSRFDRTI